MISLVSSLINSPNHSQILASARSQLINPKISLSNFTGWNPAEFTVVYTALRGVINVTMKTCVDPLSANGGSIYPQQVKFVAYSIDNKDHMADYEKEIVAVALLRFSKYPSKILYILEHQNLTAHLLTYLDRTNGTQAQRKAVTDSRMILNNVHILISEHFSQALDKIPLIFPSNPLAILYATYQLLEMVEDFKTIGLHHYMFRTVNFGFSYEGGSWKNLKLKIMDFEKTEFTLARRCGVQLETGPELSVCQYPIEGYTTYMFSVGETILDMFHLYDKDIQDLAAMMPRDGPDQRIRAIKYMLMHGFTLKFIPLMHPGYDNRYMTNRDLFFYQVSSYLTVRRVVEEEAYAGRSFEFPRVRVNRLEKVLGAPLVSFMESLIAFHPKDRISLEEALVHPIFDDLKMSFSPNFDEFSAGVCPAATLPSN